MAELEYMMPIDGETAGDIVEAFNEDKTYTFYEAGASGAMIIKIHPNYIHVKIIDNE